eukprot:m.1041755 g.1041755  ORF g.1041755 m.1041755 type:complete len:76 (-) comp24160_c0_seq6:4796-5023(-)
MVSIVLCSCFFQPYVHECHQQFVCAPLSRTNAPHSLRFNLPCRRCARNETPSAAVLALDQITVQLDILLQHLLSW